MTSFLLASESELDLGLDYAMDKYQIKLSRDVLRILYNAISKAVSEDPKLTFIEAKRAVLDEQLEQRTKDERKRFIAYSGAVSKIANRRAQFVRRQRQTTTGKPVRKLQTRPAAESMPLFWQGDQRAFSI